MHCEWLILKDDVHFKIIIITMTTDHANDTWNSALQYMSYMYLHLLVVYICTWSKGSTTILNHIRFTRNHCWNQQTRSRFLNQESHFYSYPCKFSVSLYISNRVMCISLFGKQESLQSIQESRNQAKIPKDSK